MTKRIPLPKDAILSFFGHIFSAADTCDKSNVDSKEAASIPLAESSIGGYSSTLVDAYRSHLLELDPQIDTELRRILEGYENIINSLKRGLMKINEDKRQLKSNGFDLLALKMMTLEPNPYQPHQCAILVLSVHLFSCPEHSLGGKQQLFVGSGSKDRFGRILRRVTKSLSEEEMCELNCTPEDIGSHCLRKGSSSDALGQVKGPTPVSVYLRMGPSLGKLKDRYIHFGYGADQLSV
ncbi:hypothetical protein PHMEG_00018149 [Phytophthora megakarya]|uniref:Uncharacterized protein n=1 Tax=Phytophthora megakarya TaxID=4795 RepID=A0A225VUI0_9STRA|nr:hypothetical protein PHMEG_00018149 [Phytophthora megakarya]